eukprot:TRINITY_DN38308_c0_g1_i1.p1 TRINITY_DN38308_c0_g1~~TRINITY_DN38308_c0_g1_i1.p1  ORF type:complete len:321 (+),score=61.71 TRINITY_DN38308_c0_g1_i1:399-1361(+)
MDVDTRRIRLPADAVSRLYEAGSSGGVTAVRYNREGDYVISAGKDCSLRLWNPTKETLVKTYTGLSQGAGEVIFTPDSTGILSCGGDKAVSVWDVTVGDAPTRKLRGHQARIHALAVSPEGDVLVSGSEDATIKLWDLRAARSVEAVQTLTSPRDAVTSVHFQEYTILAGSVDGYLRSYDIRTGTLVTDCVGPGVGCVTSSRDGRLRLVSCLDSKLRLFDASSGGLLGTFKGHVNLAHRLRSAFTSCEKYAVTGSETDAAVFFFSVLTGEVVHTVCHAEASGFADSRRNTAAVSVPALDCHPTSVEMVTGGSDGKITVFR